VIVLSFCHSFYHSVNKIADDRGNGRRPNLARGDPPEVINFWWSSGSACGFRINLSSFSPLTNRGFLDIC